MERLEICAALPKEEVQFLWELAEERHCTVAEMVEEAVARFVARERAEPDQPGRGSLETDRLMRVVG